jgi:hypothetical protein
VDQLGHASLETKEVMAKERFRFGPGDLVTRLHVLRRAIANRPNVRRTFVRFGSKALKFLD